MYQPPQFQMPAPPQMKTSGLGPMGMQILQQALRKNPASFAKPAAAAVPPGDPAFPAAGDAATVNGANPVAFSQGVGMLAPLLAAGGGPLGAPPPGPLAGLGMGGGVAGLGGMGGLLSMLRGD